MKRFCATRLFRTIIFPKPISPTSRKSFLNHWRSLQKHDNKTRVLDVSEEVVHREEKSARIKKLGSEVAVKTEDTCFVMQPFAAPHGDYCEKIFKPAIEKTKLLPVRADAEIFATGKIIDQIWPGRGDRLSEGPGARCAGKNP
jgi:hypothetical protein